MHKTAILLTMNAPVHVQSQLPTLAPFLLPSLCGAAEPSALRLPGSSVVFATLRFSIASVSGHCIVVQLAGVMGEPVCVCVCVRARVCVCGHVNTILFTLQRSRVTFHMMFH